VKIEVNIDCSDPLRLAAFWAAVIGDASVRGSGQPYCDLVYGSLQAGLPVLSFQRVPESRVVKNRLHLDLYVDDPESEVARMEALGATRLGRAVEGGPACAWWQVMADPEGNEFCICAGPSEAVRQAQAR
jgi:predicted enzyme related to lactoylglutathione lyase